MATIKENVEYLLQRHKKARNCDKHLMAYYWKEIDNIEFPMSGKTFVNEATSPASIIRARVLLQSSGLYLPDKEVQERRWKKHKDMRDAILIGEVV